MADRFETALTQLLEGFAAREAELWGPGNPFHAGDPFGTVVAWLWESGRKDQMATLVADAVAASRRRYGSAGGATVEGACAGLVFALPTGVERGPIIDHLKKTVPGLLG